MTVPKGVTYTLKDNHLAVRCVSQAMRAIKVSACHGCGETTWS